eukprot:9165652-Alexandrium_andersonii.AAC.1
MIAPSQGRFNVLGPGGAMFHARVLVAVGRYFMFGLTRGSGPGGVDRHCLRSLMEPLPARIEVGVVIPTE